MAATVGSALHWWAKTRGEQDALVVAGESLTYRELQDWSSRIARKIVDLEIQPGQRVGVLGPNSLTWPVIALGVLKAGGVLIPLNPRFKPAELRKVVDDAGAVLVVTPSEFAPTVDAARELGSAFDTLSFDELAPLRAGGQDDFRVDLEPDEPTALLFTSGSTGMSKE